MVNIFISYSRVDKTFTETLYTRLRQMRPTADVWYDQAPDGLLGGDDWWEEILNKIAECDIFIYVLTNESVQSKYCQAEFKEAQRLQKRIITIQARDRTQVTGDLENIQSIDLKHGVDNAEGIARLSGALERQVGLIKKNLPPLSKDRTPKPTNDDIQPRATTDDIDTPPIDITKKPEKGNPPEPTRRQMILDGILVTVVGGLILAAILTLLAQLDRGSDSFTPSQTPTTESVSVIPTLEPTIPTDTPTLTENVSVIPTLEPTIPTDTPTLTETVSVIPTLEPTIPTDTPAATPTLTDSPTATSTATDTPIVTLAPTVVQTVSITVLVNKKKELTLYFDQDTNIAGISVEDLDLGKAVENPIMMAGNCLRLIVDEEDPPKPISCNNNSNQDPEIKLPPVDVFWFDDSNNQYKTIRISYGSQEQFCDTNQNKCAISFEMVIPSPTPTATATFTPSPTSTHTPTESPTFTPSPTLTETPVPCPLSDNGTQGMVKIDGSTGAFWIDKTEVTAPNYYKFVQASGYRNDCYWSAEGWQWLQNQPSNQIERWEAVSKPTENKPRVNITYYQAEAYCRWQGGTLPTNEQWEIAAGKTANTATAEYPLNPVTTVPSNTTLNFAGSGIGNIIEVSSYPSNVNGLYDMAGNASEWVQPVNGTYSTKGGSFRSAIDQISITSQETLGSARSASDDVGFRCVKGA